MKTVDQVSEEFTRNQKSCATPSVVQYAFKMGARWAQQWYHTQNNKPPLRNEGSDISVTCLFKDVNDDIYYGEYNFKLDMWLQDGTYEWIKDVTHFQLIERK